MAVQGPPPSGALRKAEASSVKLKGHALSSVKLKGNAVSSVKLKGERRLAEATGAEGFPLELAAAVSATADCRRASFERL